MSFRIVFDGGSDGALARRARDRGIRGTLKSGKTLAQNNTVNSWQHYIGSKNSGY